MTISYSFTLAVNDLEQRPKPRIRLNLFPENTAPVQVIEGDDEFRISIGDGTSYSTRQLENTIVMLRQALRQLEQAIHVPHCTDPDTLQCMKDTDGDGDCRYCAQWRRGPGELYGYAMG